MPSHQRFCAQVAEVIRDVQVPGQVLGGITFQGTLARVRIVPTAEYPDAKPFTLLLSTRRARTKYEVLRELIETGYTHRRYEVQESAR